MMLEDGARIERQEMSAEERLSRYGEGPWLDEPDMVLFRIEQWHCALWRAVDLGSWAGYLGLPPGNPLHGSKINKLSFLSVHRGITYADYIQTQVDEPSSFLDSFYRSWWWIGFDAAGSFDLVPGVDNVMKNRLPPRPRSISPMQTYRTAAFMEMELHALIVQVDAYMQAKQWKVPT